MRLVLTAYPLSIWDTFVSLIGLPQTEQLELSVKDSRVLTPIQSIENLRQLIDTLSSDQQLLVAAVQAEHFLAAALDNGQTLDEAADAWRQLTQELLGIQRKHRRQLQMFNIHQALAAPSAFQQTLTAMKPFSPQTYDSNLSLLAACHYVAQQPGLLDINTHLQASALPLADSAFLTLDVPHILSQVAQSTIQEPPQDHGQEFKEECALLNIHLQQIQEELELKNQQLQNLDTTIEKQNSKTQWLREKLEKSEKKLQSTKTSLMALEKTLAVLNEERDAFLAHIERANERAEQHNRNLKAEQQAHKHALLAKEKQHQKELSKLEAELRQMKARAAAAEFAQLQLKQEILNLQQSLSWKLAKPIHRLEKMVKKNDQAHAEFIQHVGLLLTSEYFDVDWYLRTYPDVADSKMNPAEHYLLFGAKEGRLPSPIFDGNWYLQQYSDVAEANINPLLHFIKHGQQEGRSKGPTLLANHKRGA